MNIHSFNLGLHFGCIGTGKLYRTGPLVMLVMKTSLVYESFCLYNDTMLSWTSHAGAASAAYYGLAKGQTVTKR